ncbi:MAG TPA: MFS transporter [Acetobacteraceae bacterium]|nr:MFS transporter [Acetobacteraceae bacterium]
MASQRALRGLDWLFFFVADLQTGFGPFIAVYLTAHSWTQSELGIALGVGSASAMLAQVPAGALVDALRSKAAASAIALVGIGASAALMAWSPAFWSILLAQSLHGFTSCMLTPALAALTLTLVSRAELAERLGRNARFAAIGTAVGAALMGVLGTWVSKRAVFWLAATMCVPALIALFSLTNRIAMPAAMKDAGPMVVREALRDVLLERRLLSYLGCTVLFHLANAAMLPLAGVEITKRADAEASLIIAGCILVPQLIVALVSPLAGRSAQRWGRRGVLLVGFCALPLRAVLLAMVTNPLWIIPVQALDGLSGAAFGVITPLVAADISGRGGRFSLRMGILGLAIGGAATVSNIAAGAIATDLGTKTAFIALALAGMCAVMLVGFAMPETRPRSADAGGVAEAAPA